MRKKMVKWGITLVAFMTAGNLFPANKLTEKFDNSQMNLTTIGRGINKVENGVLKSKDAYVAFGDKELKDYTVTFRARTPKNAEQVQIWAGFRAHNRFDRYVLGLQGGLLNDLYLSRMGYMGTDELLAIRPVDFSPVPGEWYNFKIEVCGKRIRVFLNDQPIPYIDVIDENSALTPSGPVTLGGGWIETEFDDLSITELAPNALDGIKKEVFEQKISATEKESKRKQQRSAYKGIEVAKINGTRTEISLDGDWLFLPSVESDDKSVKANPGTNDDNWHVMNVPDFWNPIRIWLHGERMQTIFPKGTSDTYYQKETARCEAYTFDYETTASAWYRQWINLPQDVKGKNMELVFDAISKMGEVYVNGTLVTSNVGMFGEIRTDVSNLLKPGKNLIAVHVTRDYIKNIADGEKVIDVAVTVSVTNNMLKDIAHGFYRDSPAGIWQPVSLIITDPIKIEDVFIKPKLDGATFDVTLKNHSSKKTKISLSTDIFDNATSGLFFNDDKSIDNIELKPGEEKVVSYTVDNLKPKLWSPQSPNLYDFRFKLTANKKVVDEVDICSGFRTFESKNGLLYLNGVPYWLRGANHTPFALAPNDLELANKFSQIMKDGNIEVTRTHTTPYNKLWTSVSDKYGIGISHEGTWPWLMIKESMPDEILIEMWAKEYLSLLKKYRNHPSILFWTINNEMKFYDNDSDMERRKVKMKIISDVVKQMREIDPTRPICFDSNYRRRADIFGKDFYNDIDDGDIDDIHAYFNWYNHTVFKFFKGEFQQRYKNEGRPLISQEMATGYPNNETGHPTRFYTLIHQNPQSLIGYQSYAFGNPDLFLDVQAFMTKELAEALRRSNDKASGILHFALNTWFRNVYDAKTIEPYETYYGLKKALQPVLVSAELWGRNFYAGENIPTEIYIVNDLENGDELKSLTLNWELVAANGEKLANGSESIALVGHYKREIVKPVINIPAKLPVARTSAKLVLKLAQNGKVISENDYTLQLAERTWNKTSVPADKKIVVVDFDNMKQQLDFLGISYIQALTVSDALKAKADLYILSGLDGNLKDSEIKPLRDYITKGGKVLISNSPQASQTIYPEYITGSIVPTEGDIVNMEIPESAIFNDLDLLDIRYFNDNRREVPTVCNLALKVNRSENVEELANHTKIHGYINGTMQERESYMRTIKGYPILKIHDNKGGVIISTMCLEKTETDPIAGKLLGNMVVDLVK